MLIVRLCEWLKDYYTYDEGAYCVAQGLLRDLGRDTAFRHISVNLQNATGREIRRWRKIRFAALDLTHPEMLYHIY